jgi:uncharacterized membrane protein (Fun14 family)
MVIDAVPAAATNFNPLLTTIGYGELASFLIGFLIKKLMKNISYCSRCVFSSINVLEQQGIVNVNWDKVQSISQGVLSTVVNTVTTGGVGGSPASSSSLLPTTNLGIPLTGSAAVGFAIGIMKG